VPILRAEALTDFTSRIFQAYAVPTAVAQTVAESLVLANLKGHDSHGVIRITEYVEWLHQGLVDANGTLEVIAEQGPVLMIDGHFGFGQVIGRQATALAIAKTQAEGVCILTIRRAGHLGRIGEFMEMAAEAGLICFSLTNTHGGGVIVAPHGGRERRLSANPYAAGAPLPGGGSMIMDLATCAIAGGKIMVAKEKGVPIPPDCVVDAQGELTTDPNAFDADPPGALLPMAGHKGFALSLFAEIFAGALSGAGCSKAGVQRVANGWFAIFIDPQLFCSPEFYAEEVGNLVHWVKSSQPMQGFTEILLPGEPESRALAGRSQAGIEIDASTWGKIVAIAAKKHVAAPNQ
jgi:uncharacterized oxidoreductase